MGGGHGFPLEGKGPIPVSQGSQEKEAGRCFINALVLMREKKKKRVRNGEETYTHVPYTHPYDMHTHTHTHGLEKVEKAFLLPENIP